MARRNVHEMDLWVMNNLIPTHEMPEEQNLVIADFYLENVETENASENALKQRIRKLERENQNLRKTKDTISKDNSMLRKLLAKLMETI